MSDVLLTGIAAIAATFSRAKADQRATFMPYWMLGYPDLPTSIQIIQMLIDSGADAIELGVPFSDPLADGVVVQAAGQASLAQGTTLAQCIGAVRTLRAQGASVPFLLMSYFNPLLAYGLDRYAVDAAEAGVDGFIVPDLPPDEAHDLLRACDTHRLALIELLAPTSSTEQITLVAQTAKGFIYLVPVAGVTGARDSLPIDLEAYIARVRAASDLPLAVGFGVSTPQQATQIAHLADGIIVGSALIRSFDRDGINAVRSLAEALRAAC